MQNDSKSRPLRAPASKVNSKLIKLEREIAGIADRIRSGMDRSHTRFKIRRTIAASITAIKQKGAFLFALLRDYGLSTIKSARQLIRVAIHSGSRRSTSKSTVTFPTKKIIRKRSTTHQANALEYVFISICLGLIVICGVLILALFLQMKEMKVKIEQSELDLAANRAKLNRLEKLSQQSVIKESNPAKKAQPIRPALSFSEADIKAIRQFIKVLPPKPGAEQKIHLGDEISNLTLAPVPESLVEKLPKLRGARFTIDEDSSIAIIGEGANKVDAVLSSR